METNKNYSENEVHIRDSTLLKLCSVFISIVTSFTFSLNMHRGKFLPETYANPIILIYIYRMGTTYCTEFHCTDFHITEYNVTTMRLYQSCHLIHFLIEYAVDERS